MKTLDDLLIDVGAALDEMSAAHARAARPRPAARRTRWVALAATGLVGVAAGTAALIAVARGDRSPGSIKTTQPIGSTPLATGVDTSPAPDADTVPTVPGSTSVPAGTSLPAATIALEDVGPAGAPVVPAVLPAGYRAVMADHAEGEATGLVISRPDGWVATYIDRSGDTSKAVPSIQVQINPVIGDDVYAGLPWAPGSPDVQIGRFTGRVANGEPESVTAVIPLQDDRRLLITGTKTSFAEIETIARGLQLRADGQGADATVLPEGFELIDESPMSGPTGSAEWRVAYAKDERQETMFMVTATVDPARPAIFQLAMPMGGEAEIGGRTAYRTPTGYVLDVGTLQVRIEWAGFSEPKVPDAELEQIAATLVAMAPEDFERLETEVLANPLQPIDLDCGSYVVTRDPDTDTDTVNDGPVVPSGATIEVEVFARQPVLDVEFAVSGVDADGMTITSRPFLRLPSLGETAEPVALTWDGTIDGAVAPPGRYSVVVRAAADSGAGAACLSPVENTSVMRPGWSYLPVTFVVA